MTPLESVADSIGPFIRLPPERGHSVDLQVRQQATVDLLQNFFDDVERLGVVAYDDNLMKKFTRKMKLRFNSPKKASVVNPNLVFCIT